MSAMLANLSPEMKERICKPQDVDSVWNISLYGEVALKVVKTKFNWQLVDVSQKEHEAIDA